MKKDQSLQIERVKSRVRNSLRNRSHMLAGLLTLGLLLVLVAGIGLAQEREAPAILGTAFTYQGRLTDGGQAVDGTCDLRFSLHDAFVEGAQVGETQTLAGVTVLDGLFTVQLDFGTSAFDGQARWLAIEVRCPADAGSYTLLEPRQRLTATPYALYASTAGSAPWEGLTNVPDLQLRVSGVCPVGQAIREIGEDGGVVCGDGPGPGYEAGQGLALIDHTFLITTTYRLPQTCANGQIAEWIDGAWICGDDDLGVEGPYWLLTGNAGTAPGTNFLGTTDGVTLTLAVNGEPALRLAPTTSTAHAAASPNVMAGYGGNRVAPGVLGAVIGGGGTSRADGYGPQPRNEVGADFGTVSGGLGNSASGRAATVGGGAQNEATDLAASVGGGQANKATGRGATAAGGTGNTASGIMATVGGGYWNIAGGQDSTVAGGTGNAATAPGVVIAGGGRNSASSWYATIGGGDGNLARADYATIGGGYGISATGQYGTVGGGDHNLVTDNYGTVGGGRNNQAGDGNLDATDGAYSAVGGGTGNNAYGPWATVGGGAWNSALTRAATVGGGEANTARWWAATVGGGWNNTASEWFATIAGGSKNMVVAHAGTVPGGIQASASHFGEMAYAAGQFGTPGDAQSSLYLLRNATDDGTATELFLDGESERLTVASDRTLIFDILIVGRSDTGQSAGYRVQGVIENVAGRTRFVGSPWILTLGEDVASWDVRVLADNNNDTLAIRVKGSAGASVRWVARVQTAEVAW